MGEWKLARSRLLAGCLEIEPSLKLNTNGLKRVQQVLQLCFTKTPVAITQQANGKEAVRLKLLHLLNQTARALNERNLELASLFHHIRLSWQDGAIPQSYYAHVRLLRLLKTLERKQLEERLQDHSLRLAEYFNQISECCDGLLEQCHQAIANGLPAAQWEPLLKKAKRASILAGNFRTLRRLEVLALLSDTTSCLAVQTQRCEMILARYDGQDVNEPCMMLVKLRHAFLEQSQRSKMEATRLKDLRIAKTNISKVP